MTRHGSQGQDDSTPRSVSQRWLCKVTYAVQLYPAYPLPQRAPSSSLVKRKRSEDPAAFDKPVAGSVGLGEDSSKQLLTSPTSVGVPDASSTVQTVRFAGADDPRQIEPCGRDFEHLTEQDKAYLATMPSSLRRMLAGVASAAASLPTSKSLPRAAVTHTPKGMRQLAQSPREEPLQRALQPGSSGFKPISLTALTKRDFLTPVPFRLVLVLLNRYSSRQ